MGCYFFREVQLDLKMPPESPPWGSSFDYEFAKFKNPIAGLPIRRRVEILVEWNQGKSRVDIHKNGQDLEAKTSLGKEDYAGLFKLIHSLVGEQLEMEGYVRIHGALWKEQGQVFLMEGPSGYGKSSRVTEVIRRGGEVFTDEYVLYRENRFYALPFPISLWRNNPLLEGLSSQNVLREKGLNPQKVLLTYPLKESPVGEILDVLTTPSGPLFFLRFAWRVFWGIGNIQMWQYRFRRAAWPRLFLCAWYRYRALIEIGKNQDLKWASKKERTFSASILNSP